MSQVRSEGRTLRVGIIGLGRAGASMVPGIAAHPRVRITAGSDLRREALEKFALEFEAEVYADAEGVCRSPNVDVVFVATPHQDHAKHAILAALDGKHVIVEKPMALTLEDCDAMIEAADRAGVLLLTDRGSQGFSPPILAIRRIVTSGELGPLGMIQTSNYKSFLYQPRRPEELDTRQGGGIIYNQVPHQIDIVRLIGGGLVRSVRAMAGVWDETRPTEGAQVAFLEFEDGAAASVIFNGYGHFDSDEFHFWIGEGGQERDPTRRDAEREALRQAMQAARTPEEEAALKASTGFGGQRQRSPQHGAQHHPHFGVTLVSCHRGDLRPSADGVFVYQRGEQREVPVPVYDREGKVIDELLAALEHDRPVIRDGRWGKATLEVCLAILQSSRERREITLSHQVPVPDAALT
jgi:phthalate 4,5-cis-dihydrodiol dehydrogenase